ncbi:collagen alpha-1(I) chain-like [Alligator mississippiensis]|uniref:Collagen alpha-1(I) chain-like n=1 Tax=Alligator mississippiensis TaxID=8496 RepID=A0A151N6R5_ALLMI|nr:collagen alpha-1(I) chain-like [Alligator mississippiensis]
MAAKGGLYGCQDPACWRRVRDLHWAVVEAKGSERKGLAGLEKWYQEELPAALAGRKEKHLTQGEVVKLMQWKLTRGKFRPRLQQLVATNSQETVERCTRKAFQLLPDVAAAITELSQLKAIGPATASVDKEKDWTPHQVEMCLWAWAVAQKLCPALLQTLCLGEEEAGEDARATKKQKTK